MRALLAVAMAAVLAPSSAREVFADADTVFPQQMTARELVRSCASSSLTNIGRQRQRYCHGFVSGVEEAIRLNATGQGDQSPGRICAPADSSARRFRDAYIRYASRQDVDLERPAAVVVAEALEAAFPCR